MTSPRYAELRCRSCCSFLVGASQPEELVARAQELGLSALALTDVNGLYGVVKAHAEAKRRGLALVVGAELVVTGLVTGRKTPVVLLAMDREGYANLCRLATSAHGGMPLPPGASRDPDGRSATAGPRREKEDVGVPLEQIGRAHV